VGNEKQQVSLSGYDFLKSAMDAVLGKSKLKST
jgi:hypothetical protein